MKNSVLTFWTKNSVISGKLSKGYAKKTLQFWVVKETQLRSILTKTRFNNGAKTQFFDKSKARSSVKLTRSLILKDRWAYEKKLQFFFQVDRLIRREMEEEAKLEVHAIVRFWVNLLILNYFDGVF